MSYLDAFSLQGKVALVPGGGGAIGTAVSKALSGAGAQVVIANRTLESAETAAAGIRVAGGDAIAVQADATSEADSDAAVAAAVERFGHLDIVVNCVGGGAGKELHEAQAYPREAWDWIMEPSVRSVLVPPQAAARGMTERGTGGRTTTPTAARAVRGTSGGYPAYVAGRAPSGSRPRQWA